jgi:flavodoxin/ferredoxin
MNVTIIYFSQTGNTRRVAETMAGALIEAGHAARTISLKKALPQDAIAGDLLGIGAPCFSSQAPTPIKNYLRTLPDLNQKPAFIFATSGGAPGRVLYDLARLLKNKGADVVGGFLTRGALYHPAPCLIGRFPDRPNEADLARARRFALAIAEHSSSGSPGLVADSRTDTLRPDGIFYNLVGLLSTDRFLRLLMPEPQLDSTRCDQCKWCVNECPMHNITLQPYPVFGKQCIRCYRCLSGCPQDAFKVNWWLGNPATLSLYNTRFERWFGDVEPGEVIYRNG